MRIRNEATISNTSYIKKSSSKNQDFDSSFKDTFKASTKKEIDSYIEKINKQGTQLISTQKYSDIVGYKKLIKEYLSAVVDYTYSLNKDTSFWEKQYFATVETVNKKLDELTKEVLSEQKSNIDIVSTIDTIQGLIIDIYK